MTYYALHDTQTINAGDAAVVVRRLTQEAHLADTQAPSNWLTTDVWTRTAGRWQITARHAEALPD